MQLANTEQRWGAVSMAFHWLTVVLVLGLWGLGFTMTELIDSRMLQFELYQWHKSFGITLFVITLARLAWRLAQPHPSLPPDLKPYERALARLTHWGLYALLLAMPVAGWVSTEASPLDIPTTYFGLFTMPDPIPVSEALHETFKQIHEFLAFTLLALIALHVGAALKHHFMFKDDTLRRMLPVAQSR